MNLTRKMIMDLPDIEAVRAFAGNPATTGIIQGY